MIDTVLRLLHTGLRTWELKERRKYIDEFLEIRSKLRDEEYKPNPDDAVIDNLTHRLELLSGIVCAQIEGSNAKDMP